MKKSLAAIAVVGVLAVAVAGWWSHHRSKRPKVAISGVTLGMTMEEYRAATSLRRFEIAKVTGTPRANFVDGKLKRFDWHFSNHQYQAVRDAIGAEYPQMKCRLEKAQANAHEVCSLGSTLVLSQGQGPGWTSMVLLQ